jgi:hypothetical protein
MPSATASGTAAFAMIAIRAGHVMTSSASPCRQASTICLAARSALIVSTGIEFATVNHVNSSRNRPLNQALKGEPVHIRLGHTVVT